VRIDGSRPRSTLDSSESLRQARAFFCGKRRATRWRCVAALRTPRDGRSRTLVEVWQTAPNQLYDVQDKDQPSGHLRASFRTDAAGTYRFRTIMPVSYPIPNDGPAGQLLAAMGRHPFRPAHIHFMISAPGYRTLVTHLFLDGDEYLASDAVFGVKPSLIIRPRLIEGINTVEYGFGLADERGSTRTQVEELRRQR
jgi:protocatechuate 3,4-dioxygenase beta subunit